MHRQEAREEYIQALRLGQREQKTLAAAGKNPYPEVLDEILKDAKAQTVHDVGLLEIPIDRVVGIRSAGRTHAFTASFRPLFNLDTEFAAKWINLCEAHLGDEGIREPIIALEYMGKFYVQEGNKRASVLKSYGAARIPAMVTQEPKPHREQREAKPERAQGETNGATPQGEGGEARDNNRRRNFDRRRGHNHNRNRRGGDGNHNGGVQPKDTNKE